MSSERTAATLHMIECEKTKFAKRCADLENDNITLQQANDAAQTMREAALQERSKVSNILYYRCVNICIDNVYYLNKPYKCMF